MRLDVLESELLLQARLANTIAFAALHGNPAADIEKGSAQASTMYTKALTAIPYFATGAASGSTSAMSDRLKAVDKWRKMVGKDKSAEIV